MSNPISSKIFIILNIALFQSFKYDKSTGYFVKSKELHIFIIILTVIGSIIYLVVTMFWIFAIENDLYLVDTLNLSLYYSSIFIQMFILIYCNLFKGDDLMNILNTLYTYYYKFHKTKPRLNILYDYVYVALELGVAPLVLTTTTFLYFEDLNMIHIGIASTISSALSGWAMGMLLPYYIYMRLIIDFLHEINVSLNKLLTPQTLELNEINAITNIDTLSVLYFRIHNMIVKLTKFYSLLICVVLFNISMLKIWQTYRCVIFFDTRKFHFGAYKTFLTVAEFSLVFTICMKTMFLLSHLGNSIDKKTKDTTLILNKLYIKYANQEFISSAMLYNPVERVEMAKVQIKQFLLNIFHMDKGITPLNMFEINNELIAKVMYK